VEHTLFDFDFTESQKEMFSEERVSKKFRELQGIFKKRRNAYFVSLSEIPRDILMYLEEFEKRGWIERRGDLNNRSGINILDPYLAFHTVDEVVEPFRQEMRRKLASPDVNWYKNVLDLANGSYGPIRWKDDEVKEEASRQMHEISKKAAMELGLKHFIEVPSSRGAKMDPFDSKWSRKHVLPVIAEKVIPITDYEEMDNFFRSHMIFFGRDDWKPYGDTPYPNFKQLLPSMFHLACLCEAKDEKTVKLILDYAGSSYGRKETSDFTYLYPEGWSYERYLESLTDEDKEKIRQDQDRLKRLHGERYAKRYPWDQ
jgi:hypothetical protein